MTGSTAEVPSPSRGEGIHYFGFSSMPQLGQWLLAWPFIRLFGESFVTLRLVTLLLALFGTIAFYDLLRRETGGSPWLAAFVAAALAFNPLWLLLAGTFVTDVPALALALAALACYSRGLRGGRLRWLAAGTGFALLAVLTRQNTAAAPLAAALVCWRLPSIRNRGVWLAALALPLVVAGLTHLWLNGRGDVVPFHVTLPSATSLLYVVTLGGQLLGLAAFPVLLLRSAVVKPVALVVSLAVLLGGAVLLAFVLPSMAGRAFPYGGPILTNAGGAMDTIGFVWGERPLLLGPAGRGLLTFLGCVTGALLLQRLACRSTWRPRNELLLLYGLVSVALLVVTPSISDKYFLVLVPVVLSGAAAAGAKPPRPLAGLTGLAVLAVLSVVLTHDVLAWSAAPGSSAGAVARGIPPAAIEGGVEWNGWYAAEGAEHASIRPPGPRLLLWTTRAWFPKVEGRFALSFTPLPGTTVVDEEPYLLWLPPGRRRFLLLAPAATDESQVDFDSRLFPLARLSLRASVCR